MELRELIVFPSLSSDDTELMDRSLECRFLLIRPNLITRRKALVDLLSVFFEVTSTEKENLIRPLRGLSTLFLIMEFMRDNLNGVNLRGFRIQHEDIVLVC
jgi:hypothetical protein